MAVFPDKIILKNSTDSQAAIEAAIGSGGGDEIVYGELVIGRESGAAKLYTVDSDGNIAVVGGGGSSSVIVSTTAPTQRPDTTALQEGDLWWDSDDSLLYVYVSSVWTLASTVDLSTSSVDDLSDVDTTTVAPTLNQALVWNGTTWVPGSVAADVSSTSIDALLDVDTTTTAPTTGKSLTWDGTNWVPGDPDLSNNVLDDIGNVNTPVNDGQTSTSRGYKPLLWNPVANTFVVNNSETAMVNRSGYKFYTGHEGYNRTTSYIEHKCWNGTAQRGIRISLDTTSMPAGTDQIRLTWPTSQPIVDGVMFADWNGTSHRLAVREFTLSDITELQATGFAAGDSVFYDGLRWTAGDMFAPGTAVSVTDLGASTTNMLGQTAMYADQAAMEADGWTFIVGGGIDDTSTTFSPGASWTGLDFLGLGVSSQNWKVADVAVHFDADPSHQLNNYDQPMTAWSFDLLCQFFTTDAKLLNSGWQIHNDGSQDWLVVRTEHQVPWDDGTDGIPCEAWFNQTGKIRMMWGTPVDTNSNFDFLIGPTSNGIASNGRVIINPTGLTVSANRAFEFSATATSGITINRLADVDTTTTAPTDGQVLAWDNANSVWEPASLRALLGIGEYADDTAAGSGGVASGALYYNTTNSNYVLKS